MPNKPTEPYGFISFSKNGKVRKLTSMLPPDKANQEFIVGELFVKYIQEELGEKLDIYSCEERDHDFRMKSDDIEIIVQETEVVSRDYIREISRDSYDRGDSGFQNFVLGANNDFYGVDVNAKEAVLLDRIKKKISKCYSKEKSPLWLLIWTVCSDFHPFYITGGEKVLSKGVIEARKYLSNFGAEPFDEVWFMNVQTRPSRIWPI